MKFSRKTIEGIKFYVYGLRYPGKKQYFYIGKGKGNRVFSHIKQKNRKGIKILLSTKGKLSHYDFEFKDTDNLIVGRESAGVPDYVHKQSDQIIRIPMNSSARSLNVAVSSAIVISEANRQLKLF